LCDAVAAGADFITMGPLSPYRDFLDARDLGRAVVAAALAPALPTAVINIGSGRAVPARTAVELLAEAAGFSGEIREERMPPSRSATVDWILADISRAVDVLGWRPTHALADSTKAIWGAMVAESRAGG
jgi:NDP-hexose 4-ketoreductase